MPIELEHVSYTYPTPAGEDIPALSDVSFTIKEGEFIGIMGQTGCGKTTMIQLMAGLFKPSGGRILLDGQDINARSYDRSILRRQVGIVFQHPEYQLFESTVEKDVAFGLKHSGLNRREISERVAWALTTMGFSFDAIRAQSPLSLSGGEKRRVAIAGILAMRPKIMIFDEPFAGLDALGREAFLQLAKNLHASGLTMIMISHHADAIAELATRLLVLSKGKLSIDSTVEQAFSDISRMQSLHLDVSAARQISSLLSERGWALPSDIIRYETLLHAIKVHKSGGDVL